MSFHKQQKCFGLQPVNPPLTKTVEIWRRGGGGGDDVEKVGRSRGVARIFPGVKPEKATGVLRNVLTICPGSYFQGSADQESFIRNQNSSQLPAKAKSDNSGKRTFCEM